MVNFDRITVFNYITGNDLDCDIEELENDYKFMRAVIDYTNDKRMYNLCSDKVKKNYKFTKFLINKFKDDIDFIEMVAKNFLNNIEEVYDAIELIIMMRNLTENKNKELFKKYDKLANLSYASIKRDINMERLIMLIEEEYDEDMQMGFWYVDDSSNGSKIILDFYARKFTYDLFMELRDDFEEFIHSKGDSFKDIESNLNKCLIEFAYLYDTDFGKYILNNPDVLNVLKGMINNIKNRWTYYNDYEEEKIYNILIDAVCKYINEYCPNCNFDAYYILLYIGRELGIEDKIKQHFDFCEENYNYQSVEEILESSGILEDMQLEIDDLNDDNDLLNSFEKDSQTINFLDMKYYLAIKKIVTKIINTSSRKLRNYTFEELCEVNSKDRYKSRILR